MEGIFKNAMPAQLKNITKIDNQPREAIGYLCESGQLRSCSETAVGVSGHWML